MQRTQLFNIFSISSRALESRISSEQMLLESLSKFIWSFKLKLTHDDSHVAGQQFLHNAQSDATIATGDDSNAIRLLVEFCEKMKKPKQC